jgi:hypothetical protein
LFSSTPSGQLALVHSGDIFCVTVQLRFNQGTQRYAQRVKLPIGAGALANVMKQAANLDLKLGMLRPGIKITTSSTDYQPIKQLFLVKFDGRHWRPISD